MIKVLKKTAFLLRTIGNQPGIRPGELAAAAGFHKATLSNILKTLAELGYVRRDEAGGCRLGPALLDLARQERRRRSLPALAEECARELAAALRETVTVGQLLHGDRFNVAKATVDRSVSVDARIEMRPTPYDTATGRALVAFCAAAELSEVLDRHGLPGPLWNNLDTRAAFDCELAAIRRAGMATYGPGEVRSLAMPVHGPAGELLLTVGVSVPAYRLDEARLQVVKDILTATVVRLETQIRLFEEQ